MSDTIPDLTNLQEWNSFCEKSMTVLEVLTLLNNRHRERMAAVIADRDLLKAELRERTAEVDRMEHLLETTRTENELLRAALSAARETLRDRFAMAALTGELASNSSAEAAEVIDRMAIITGRSSALYVANICYELADAMLAARKPAAAEDPHQTEDYQRHVDKAAEGCAADDSPCDACDGPSQEGGGA